MNQEVLSTVFEGDLPQKTRNIIKDNEYIEAKNASELKIAINNFLWRYLPMKTTLREAEIMACKIFEIVWVKQEV